MKTFQTFNEDIEERRAQARQRAIQLSQTARDRVADYQETQKQKRLASLKAQQQKKQREKEDEKLVRKAKEEAKRELQDT